MRKRVYVALAVFLVAIGGVGVWQVLRLWEPVYQGRSLRVWLKQYGISRYSWYWLPGGTVESGKQAETAIRQIGTNAIPTCLKMMTTRESPLKLKLLALVPQRWLDRFHMPSRYDYRILGAYGLIALGADEKSSVPALVALLNDKDPGVRYPAVFALRSLGPVAGDALPSLINCLKDPEFAVQSDAILGLGEIRQEPERVIPILVKFLDEPQNPQHSIIIRADAIWSLRQFGAQAKPAVLVLLRLLNDAHEGIRSDATNALKAIDPEAAAKAGVE